jgi:hypothetical protein
MEFIFTNIVTCLPEGQTQLYIQYQGIPGYADGVYVLPITKSRAPSDVLNFYALPYTIAQGDQVVLTWLTYDVDYVELGYLANNQVQTLSSRTGAIPLNSPDMTKNPPSPIMYPQQETTYTLIGYKNGVACPNQPQRTVTVAVPDAQIDAFAARPTAIYEDAYQVALTWTTEHAASCDLEPAEVQSGGPIPLNVASGNPYLTRTPVAANDYSITLQAYGQGGGAPTSSSPIAIHVIPHTFPHAPLDLLQANPLREVTGSTLEAWGAALLGPNASQVQVTFGYYNQVTGETSTPLTGQVFDAQSQNLSVPGGQPSSVLAPYVQIVGQLNPALTTEQQSTLYLAASGPGAARLQVGVGGSNAQSIAGWGQPEGYPANWGTDAGPQNYNDYYWYRIILHSIPNWPNYANAGAIGVGIYSAYQDSTAPLSPPFQIWGFIDFTQPE